MIRSILPAIALLLPLLACCTPAGQSTRGEQATPASTNRGAAQSEQARSARRMIRASEGALAPVYAPLAEQIVRDFNLSDADGVGIDVGSGPGTLIVELCKRTEMHWINADINPHFFSHFYDLAEEVGVAHRVSALRADAQNLPFRDNYAAVIVSRGSYQFWKDRRKAFDEIYRVLEPGGAAYIGRGLARDMPVDEARQVRKNQGGGPRYDRFAHARQLANLMNEMAIEQWDVQVPTPDGPKGANYGVWVEFHKPCGDAGR